MDMRGDSPDIVARALHEYGKCAGLCRDEWHHWRQHLPEARAALVALADAHDDNAVTRCANEYCSGKCDYDGCPGLASEKIIDTYMREVITVVTKMRDLGWSGEVTWRLNDR